MPSAPVVILINRGEGVIEQTEEGDRRLLYWRARRQRRLLFMLGRYVLLMAIILVIAWVTGGLWLRGIAVVASVFLLLRLLVFFYAGRHLEERIAERGSGHRRFLGP